MLEDLSAAGESTKGATAALHASHLVAVAFHGVGSDCHYEGAPIWPLLQPDLLSSLPSTILSQCY